MKILDLVRKESGRQQRDIAITSSISGIANAAVLAIINVASQQIGDESASLRYLLMFVVAIFLYVYCLRFTFNRMTQIFENVVQHIRHRLVRKIRNTELDVLDSIGESTVYNRLTQETAIISQFQRLLTASLQAAVMVTFALIYIAFLSIHAFLITVVLVAGGIFVYMTTRQQVVTYSRLTTRKEVEYFDSVTDLLDGFKEVKLSEQRGTDLLSDNDQIAAELKELKQKTSSLYDANYIFSQCFFYILLGAIVFVLPRLVPTYSEVITEVATSILFIIGPLSTVVSALPAISQANVAAENIYELEQQLDQHQAGEERSRSVHPRRDFERIAFDAVEFSYRDESSNQPFSVGPLSLEIGRGEFVFVIGGNGSGKSTLLKLLTTLYFPERGQIRIDGQAVTRENAPNYRELFSVIFADFHLFQKLYGLRHIDEQAVFQLLAQLGLENKTSYEDGAFTNIELSTGQRKRLALLVTLLEDRPIYIFDEWAAEQDPEFRRYFYEELLNNLKARGKTIIAVTHDDRYFDIADRVVKMNYGKIEFDRPSAEIGRL
jgi:putative ATP-binding cassette transporter